MCKTISKTVKCDMCFESFDIEMSEAGHQAWQDGGLIQEELPELEAWERELLLSETCDKCWHKLFPYANSEDE